MADKEEKDQVSTLSATNPLSRKLNKILETRLDNDKVSRSRSRPSLERV